ncbi:MBL fold metallo-hydrolase [Paenochrobactrum glaciei]|uniref:Metallo-beta-lactamase domain-containing protein n=1 Tax=Paenochrobactrum glaciei TaxID=486407 RepID=A0ABN1GDV9_9HYPH
MAKLINVSGLSGKMPACFVLEMDGKRIMLDLGEGPEPGIYPDLAHVGDVDCIVLSHAHMDHAAALHLRPQIGNPPVYATRTTWSFLGDAPVAEADRRFLPDQGACLIEGLTAQTGRCGHSPGGIWVHFSDHGGVTYTGDWSVESNLLPFDMPPVADTLLTDASYGDRDEALEDQFSKIYDACEDGAVLCVPSHGRGPEMALAFLARGHIPRLGKSIYAEIEQLLENETLYDVTQKPVLKALLQQQDYNSAFSTTDIIITTEANAESGHSAELLAEFGANGNFIFTGHVPDNTPAKTMLTNGTAQWFAWNVHPRQRDVIAIADQTRARFVLPAFVDPKKAENLFTILGERLCCEQELTLPE